MGRSMLAGQMASVWLSLQRLKLQFKQASLQGLTIEVISSLNLMSWIFLELSGSLGAISDHHCLLALKEGNRCCEEGCRCPPWRPRTGTTRSQLPSA